MIRLQGVSKVYDGSTVAIRDANTTIQKGEFVFLVGPSGSGKSTLIRLLMREEKPTSGEIWVAGRNIAELPDWKVPYLRRSVGTVFQDFKLLPNKTVFQNVAFALEVIGRPRGMVAQQVPKVLKLVGLSSKSERLPRQLSGGEQQRVSIARAFVNRPLILLADEPTGNLDPATSVGIMRLLDRINRTGTTVVMATHDHAIVDAMRRRVMQLERGRIVRDESRGVYEGPAVTDATPTVNNLAPVETNGQQAPPVVEAPQEVAASPGAEASRDAEALPEAEASEEVVVTPGEPDEG